MKYIKKLSIGLVIAILSSGIFIGLIPSKVYAAPEPLEFKTQYVIFRSGANLKYCIKDTGYFAPNFGGRPGNYDDSNEQKAIDSIFNTVEGVPNNKLYAAFSGAEQEFDCNTKKSVNAALKALGYASIFDFVTANGLGSKDVPKKDIQAKINKRVEDLGVPNNLYDTRPFRYWYFNTVFRAPIEGGGCKGTFGDEPSVNAKTNIGPSSFWYVGKAGVAKEYKYARYNVGTGDNLPDLDDAVLNNVGLGTKEITCIKIARQITEDRAKAYEDYLKNTGGSAEQAANTSGSSGVGSDSSESGGAADDDFNVQCSFSIFNPISYFMCPLITGFIQAMNQLDSAITSQLSLDTNTFFTGDNETAFKKVWTNMRNLALSFIVIVGLLMVIGTAIEVGPFDPYTVKKVMPRLLVAVIVISLSWPLVIFLIDASNALGYTIRTLIQTPFKTLLDRPIQFGGGQQWIAAAGVAGAGLVLGLVGLLSFVATAFLGVTLAFLVLILRQILVILLAVIAPIAIAMYILPNTQKAGKAWWDLFARALLVFPIIAAFIVTGRVFAAITVANSGDSPGTIEGFIAFFAYYGPYFALPFAFRLAGGAVGQIGGFVNDKSRGGFDRLKKFRQGQTQKNAQKVVSGNRFKETGFANRLNTPLQGAALVASGKAGADPRKIRGRVASAQAQDTLRQSQELLEKNDAFRAIAQDNDLLKQVMSDSSSEEIKSALASTGRFDSGQLPGLVSMVEQARNSGSRSATKVAAARAQAKTGTGYATHSEMYEDIIAASSDAMVRNSMLAGMKSDSAQAQRYDLSTAGHVDQYNAMAELEKTQLGTGTKSAKQINQEMRKASFEQGGVHSMIGMKESAFAKVTTDLQADYADAVRRGSTTEATEIASQMTSLRGAMGSASPKNRQHIAAMLEASGVDLSIADSVDQQFGAKIGGAAGVNKDQVTEEIRSRAGLYDQPAGKAPPTIPEMGTIGVPGPTPPGGIGGPGYY